MKYNPSKSYTTIVVYKKDDKRVGVIHGVASPASIFPDNSEAVLVRPNDQPEMLFKIG